MITYERLKELLDYNADLGIFIWRKTICPAAKIGTIAGTPHDGYVRIGLDGKYYLSHRLAWFYVYKEWPPEIDHRDMNRNNTRLLNLRPCNKSKNRCNTKAFSNNRLGIKGVRFNKGFYEARIQFDKRPHFIGYFDTAEKAQDAYQMASLKYHGEFGRAA